MAEAATTKKPAKLRVRATQTGYYDLVRRREGDVFDISGETDKDGKVKAFSERWMERVAARTPQRISTAQGALSAVTDAQKRENALARANEGVDADQDPPGAADVLFGEGKRPNEQ